MLMKMSLEEVEVGDLGTQAWGKVYIIVPFWLGKVTQLLSCLASMGALSSAPHKLKMEDKEFKVIFDYIASSRAAWATVRSYLKNK